MIPLTPLLSLFTILVAPHTGHAAPTSAARALAPNTAHTAWVQRATPTISIDTGALAGTTTSLAGASASAIKFLGVPFARSPPTRFAPAERPVTWGAAGKVRAARRWRDGCVQQFVEGPRRNATVAAFGDPAATESEDCLYLNVYAPAAPAEGRGRAVLFWLYGGGSEIDGGGAAQLQFGNAGQRAYDGSALASFQDVVVVTANYRTNVFGFPGAPELPIDRRNLGLLDQRMALGWVQRNIDVFGGDPDKVTIFGESGGAYSIDALLTSYGRNERPPYRGAILQSGQASYYGKTSDPKQNTINWGTLADELGCRAPGAMACMKAAEVDKIKSIIEQKNLIFTPVADNKTLISSPALRRTLGMITTVPVLIGTSTQDGSLHALGEDDLSKIAQMMFGNDSKMVGDVVKRYPVGNGGFSTGHEAVAQLITDFQFQCPTVLFSKASAADGIPTWRYLFNSTVPNRRQAKSQQRNVMPPPSSSVASSTSQLAVSKTAEAPKDGQSPIPSSSPSPSDTLKSVETAKPVETAKSAERTKSVSTTKSSEPSKVAPSPKTAEFPKSTEGLKSTETPKSITPKVTKGAQSQMATASPASSQDLSTEPSKSDISPKAVESPKPVESTKAIQSSKVTVSPKSVESPKVIESSKAPETLKVTESPLSSQATKTESPKVIESPRATAESKSPKGAQKPTESQAPKGKQASKPPEPKKAPKPKTPKNPKNPKQPPQPLTLTHLVFGTFARAAAPLPPRTAALSEFVQGAWARFAKDPGSGPGWTGVGHSPAGFDLGSFGGKGRGAGVVVLRARNGVDGRCGVFEEWYKKHSGV